MMQHPSIPHTTTTLTTPEGRTVGVLGIQGATVPRYITIDETDPDTVRPTDDPDDVPLGHVRFSRVGSVIWLDDKGAERSAIFERQL